MMMKKHSINDHVSLEYPDGFTPADKSEVCRYNTQMGNSWGIKSGDGKTVISVGWTDPVNPVISLIVSRTSLLKGFDKYAKKNLSCFEKGKEVSKNIGGSEGIGYDFSFTSADEGNRLFGEIIAVKLDGRYFLFKYITGSDDQFFCSQAFDMVLSTLSVSE